MAISNAEICMAVKQGGDRCTYGVKTILDIEGEEVGVCGTHFNVFERGGEFIVAHPMPVANQMAGEQQQEKEEEVMDTYIYHFMTEKMEGDVRIIPRILTNDPVDNEMKRYWASVQSRHPVDSLLALGTGNWHVHLLQERLAEMGHTFRIMILSNKEVAEMSDGSVMKYHAKSSFSFANDSHTFFVRVDGQAGFGLEAFGLTALDTPKIMKRLSEICRLSELAYYSKTNNLKTREFTSNKPDIFYDGMNFISQKFALRMTNSIMDSKRRRKVRYEIHEGILTRVNLRVLTPFGLIKGDAIIVEDQEEDVVYHGENLKPELSTNGWVMATMFKHNPHHMAVWDTQTWVNNRNILIEQKHQNDLDLLVQGIVSDFQEGVVPDWLMLGEDAHTDTGLPEYERLSELMDRQYYKWQAYGLDIRAAQNLVYMATNGVIKRMERDKRFFPETYYRKTWTPMTNAFLAAVNTKESLMEMGGIELANQTDTMFFHPHYGIIMSGERFLGTYSLHGGWDLDDTVKVILVKVFGTDTAKLDGLYADKALDPAVSIPSTVEEATPVALLVRSPNGPGEFSIEALPEDWQDMPWHKFNEENIPVVNLDFIGDAQPTLMADVAIEGIPASLEFTHGPLTSEQCVASIFAQRLNPGIGAVCNSLMNWSMTFGPSFPDEMLANLEDMVDMTQQGRDPVSFEAVGTEVDHLYDQMVDDVHAADKRVDRLLSIAHPIPNKYASELEDYMIPGRFTRFNQLFGQKITELKTLVMNNSLQMRNEVPLVAEIRNLNVSQETLDWARAFNKRYSDELKQNSDLWVTPDDLKNNPFAMMHFEQQRTLANKVTVSKAVEELKAFGGDDTHKRVLSLWHSILIPQRVGRQKWVMGLYDRLIFQPGKNESIMDLLLDALVWRGLAQKPQA